MNLPFCSTAIRASTYELNPCIVRQGIRELAVDSLQRTVNIARVSDLHRVVTFTGPVSFFHAADVMVTSFDGDGCGRSWPRAWVSRLRTILQSQHVWWSSWQTRGDLGPHRRETRPATIPRRRPGLLVALGCRPGTDCRDLHRYVEESSCGIL